MIVYMYYGLLPEIKLSYLILSYNDKIHKNHRETEHNHATLTFDLHSFSALPETSYHPPVPPYHQPLQTHIQKSRTTFLFQYNSL